MNTGRILAYAAIVLAVWGAAGDAAGQFRVGDDGSALDANNRLGSGGFNTRRLAPVAVTADQVVNGNVTGGRAFRGSLQTGDTTQFRGSLASDTSDRFIRDSSGAPRRGQAVVAPGTASPFFSRDRTMAVPSGFRVSPFTQTLVQDPRAQRGAVDLQMRLPPSSTRIFDPSQPKELLMSAPGNRDPQQGMLVASPLFGVRSVNDGGLNRQTDPRMAISRPELTGLDPFVLADLRRQASQNMVNVNSPEYTGLAAEAGARAVGPGAEVEGAEPKVAPGTELVRAAGAAPAGAGLEGPVVSVKPIDERVVDGKPAARPADAKPVDAKPGDAKPADGNAGEVDPKGVKPVEGKPDDGKPGAGGRTAGQASVQNTQLAELSSRWSRSVPAAGGATRTERLKLDAVNLAPVAAAPAMEIRSLAEGQSQASVKTALVEAEALVRKGKFLEALARYELAEAAAPGDATIVMGRANAELASGRFVAAEGSIRRAIAIEPAIVLARVDLRELLGEERLQATVRELKAIAVDEKGGPNAPMLLAYIAYHSGNGARAGELMDEAIRRAGGDDDALSLLRARYSGGEGK
jgi:hypothetical protein